MIPTYDYVIVGAGSAGCVLAYRLSEDPAVSVLVLEAGGSDDRAAITEPLRWFENIGSDVDWAYRTTPQQHAAGREVPWPRGKVLGGSSSINAMVHLRGTAADYDRWVELGSPGWSYQDVLPALRALETFEGGDPNLRGSDGPLRVGLPVDPNPHSRAAMDAALELGFPLSDDLNGASVEGVGWNQLAIADGQRHSAAGAFLRPALARENLTVVAGAQVRRLILDSGARLVGVEYQHRDRVRVAAADREVILTAGAIETPKLLLLSGIGPADELRALGIEVHVDLTGVGRNLHDHPGVPVTYRTRRPIPVGHNQSSEVGLFCRSQADLTAPDLQFGILNVPITSDGITDPSEAFSFYPSFAKPRSRGTLTLRSADRDVPPVIDPHYLREPADVDGLVRAIEIARDLAGTRALGAWAAEELTPGPTVTGAAALREQVRRTIDTWFHPVGTCRMGVDPEAVVDPQLRVHGVERLRIADAAVIPEITTGNTNAPTMAIAWRAADLIRSESITRAPEAAGAS